MRTWRSGTGWAYEGLGVEAVFGAYVTERHWQKVGLLTNLR